MKRIRRQQQPGNQRGFTLVEALVQLSSLRANGSAFQRSQATFLAYDITDRMRVNRNAALSGGYDFVYGAALPVAPATVAQQDILDWMTRLRTTLPVAASGTNPDAQIQRAGNLITVRIRWDDSKGVDAPLEFVMRTGI
jgi:type IV pilus assembly protein PilV